MRFTVDTIALANSTADRLLEIVEELDAMGEALSAAAEGLPTREWANAQRMIRDSARYAHSAATWVAVSQLEGR